jgi:hypothetical protein
LASRANAASEQTSAAAPPSLIGAHIGKVSG